MINGLSKEQVAKLSPEEQEALARVALDQAMFRRSLLAKAAGYRGRHAVPSILFMLMLGLWMWTNSLAILFPALVIVTFFLVLFHTWGLNSRIDALLRVLDLDRGEVRAKPRRASE